MFGMGMLSGGAGGMSGSSSSSAESGVSGSWIQNKGASTTDNLVKIGTIAGAFISIITLAKILKK